MSLEDDVEQNAKSKLSERTGWSEEIAWAHWWVTRSGSSSYRRESIEEGESSRGRVVHLNKRIYRVIIWTWLCFDLWPKSGENLEKLGKLIGRWSPLLLLLLFPHCAECPTHCDADYSLYIVVRLCILSHRVTCLYFAQSVLFVTQWLCLCIFAQGVNFATGVYYDTGQSQERRKYDIADGTLLWRIQVQLVPIEELSNLLYWSVLLLVCHGFLGSRKQMWGKPAIRWVPVVRWFCETTIVPLCPFVPLLLKDNT